MAYYTEETPDALSLSLRAALEEAARRPVAPAAPVTNNNSWVGGGISAGMRELRGLGGAGIQALGNLTGLQGVEDWGRAAAKSNFEAAARVGRPDLEVAPWQEGGASTIPWLVYQGAKTLPSIAGMLGAGVLMPAAAVPAGLARVGTTLPGWLGGGAAGEAVAGSAARLAAEQAGMSWAKNVAGGTLAGYLPAAGQLYRSEEAAAEAAGEPVSAGGAARALGLAPAVAAVQAVQPAQLAALARPVAEGGSRLGHVALSAASGGVGGMLQEGMAAGIEQALRPDLSLAERMDNVVQSALVGGALGGVLGGGAGSLSAFRRRRPTNEDINNVVDAVTVEPPAQGELPGVMQQGPPVAETPVAVSEVLPSETPRPFENFTDAQLAQRAKLWGDAATLGTATPDELTGFARIQEEQAVRRDQTALPLAGGEDLRGVDLTTRVPPAPLPPLADVPPINPLETPAETPAPVSPQAELPRDVLVSSPSAEPVVTAQPVAAPFSARDYFRDQIGVKPNQTIAKMEAADPADIANEVLRRMEDTTNRRPEPQWVQAAAEHFGLRDATGQERNLPAEIAALQQSGAPENVIADLQAKQSVLETAATRRVERDGREAPPVVQGPAQTGVELPLRPPETPFLRSAPQAADAPAQPVLSEPAFAQAWDRTIKLIGPGREGAVNVVSTPGELPAHVQAAAEAQGIPVSEIRGVQDRGQTYVVRSNVRNEADLQETILHEVLGHGGTRALLGTGRVDRLTELFDTVGGVDGLRKLAWKYKVEKPWSEYIPDRALNDADKAQIFDEFLAQAAGTATGRASTALRAWAGELKQGLVAMLDKIGLTALARRFEGFSALDTAVMLKRMRVAVNEGRALDGGETSFSRMAPPQVNETFKGAVQQADVVLGRLLGAAGRTDASVKATNAERFLTTINHWADRWDHLYTNNPIRKYIGVQDARGRDVQLHAQLTRSALDQLQQLPPKAREIVQTLQKASAARYDPAKTPEQHTHLFNENGKLSPEHRKNIEALNADLGKLNQMRGLQVYHDLRALNDLQHVGHLATNLRMWIPPEVRTMLPTFSINPAEAFRADPAIHESIGEARNYYQKYLTDGLAEINKYLTTQRQTALDAPDADRAKILKNMSPLESVVRNTEKSLASAKQVPYFHLGRSGDWFVAFDLKDIPGPDGKPLADRKSVEAVAEALRKAGHENIELSWANDKPDAYIRVERASEADSIRETLLALQKQGHIQPESIVRGKRTETQVAQRVTSKLSEDFKEFINESSAFVPEKGATAAEIASLAAEKAQRIDEMQRFLLDVLPDSSINKVLVTRAGVRGYSSDMTQNFARRAQIGGNSLASMSAAPEIGEILRGMRADVRAGQGQGPGSRTTSEIANMQGVLDGLTSRQREVAAPLENSVPDAIRAANHAYFTAASPAYAMMQLMSIPQLVLPELGKRHGFVAAGKEIARSTPDAFKILRAAFSKGAETDMLHAVDGVITSKVLAQSGVSKSTVDFVMKMINLGNIEIGSQSREIGRVADGKIGGVGTNTLRYATAMGYYAETFARLVTVLSAARLHGMDKPDVYDYAGRVNKETQFTFSEYNNAKLLSRSGPAGSLTPIMSSFLSWQAQVTEKMYRELGTAFGGMASGSPEARQKAKTEARRFLVGHLGAMTVLAGTLGLPFASVAARVMDKVGDMFGEEGEAPVDVKKAYREFLADSFGKDFGEMLAHGASRGIGVDIAGRVGEQDILPFSKFLTDRRKARDVAEDLVIRSAGSPVSAAVNIFDGLNDIFSKGDVIQGMSKVLPTALRNQFNAYRMAAEGYVDRNGNQLPMTPGARAILSQAIGFAPSERAEYNEGVQTQRRRETDLEAMGAGLRKDFAIAVERGDTSGAQEALRQGAVFSQRNPAYAPSFEATLERRARERETARTLGVTLGANVRDIPGLSRYLNVGP